MKAASASGRGFTLIETVVAVALLAVLFIFVLPNVDRLSPKYALRAAAREIGSTVDLCRSNAVSDAKTYAIRYELDRGTYSVFGPPSDEPDEPLGEPGPFGTYQIGGPRRLPSGVRIVAVKPDVTQTVSGGEMAVRFSPLGYEGSHVVVLENEKGERLSLKYNAMIGLTDYREGEVEFRRVGTGSGQ